MAKASVFEIDPDLQMTYELQLKITGIFNFTKPVIYLSDVTVFTKELFQIRLTLISNSSDCKNAIALFVGLYDCVFRKQVGM